jgi:hypothetical protein
MCPRQLPPMSRGIHTTPARTLGALATNDLWLWERLIEFRDGSLHRWSAAQSAYSGGLGNVRKDRQIATMRGGSSFNPTVSRWFCCVEDHSSHSAATLRENPDPASKRQAGGAASPRSAGQSCVIEVAVPGLN